MLIQFKDGTKKHLERGVAEGFIASGSAVAVSPRRETCQEAEDRYSAIHGSQRTSPDTLWSIRPAQSLNEQRWPPQVYAKCKSCGANFFAENPRKRITTDFRHAGSCSGVAEKIPDDILVEYERQRDLFYPPKTIVAVVKDRLAEVRESLRLGVGQ
jgi:hypothetical protein